MPPGGQSCGGTHSGAISASALRPRPLLEDRDVAREELPGPGDLGATVDRFEAVAPTGPVATDDEGELVALVRRNHLRARFPGPLAISLRPVNQEPAPWLASSSHQHFLHTRLHSPIRVMSAIISYAVTGWLPITIGSE